MCGGPWQGLECLVGRRNGYNGHWLGPGNTNQRSVGGYVPGIAPSRYPPMYSTPGTPPPHTRRGPPVLQCGLASTAVLGPTKEILGVNNAL